MICEYCGGDAASGCGPITTCGRTEHYSKIDCAAFLLLQNAELKELLGNVLQEHYQGHSPCSCPEIKKVFGDTVMVKPKEWCKVGLPYGQSGVPDFCNLPRPCPMHEKDGEVNEKREGHNA